MRKQREGNIERKVKRRQKKQTEKKKRKNQ